MADGSAALAAASGRIGTPYEWGGGSCSGPTAGIPGGPHFGPSGTIGFDCSGLTLYAWCKAGVAIPRTAIAQYAGIPHVSRSDLAPGDLVFFFHPIHHTAIYAGGGEVVAASSSHGKVVRQAMSDFGTLYVGAGRPGGGRGPTTATPVAAPAKVEGSTGATGLVTAAGVGLGGVGLLVVVGAIGVFVFLRVRKARMEG